MNTRTIKVSMHRDLALYEELMSAMMEDREYDGCYIIQYSEHQENGYKVAVFMLQDTG